LYPAAAPQWQTRRPYCESLQSRKSAIHTSEESDSFWILASMSVHLDNITAVKNYFTEMLILRLNFQAVVCYLIFSARNILYGCSDLRHSFVAVLHTYIWIRHFEYFKCAGSLNRRFCVLHLNSPRVKILFNV
jgi:hypothetical protein